MVQSVAFEVELNQTEIKKIPEALAKKLAASKQEKLLNLESLLEKLASASNRKKIVLDSKIIKAKETVVKAKETALKARQHQETVLNENFEKLQSKIVHAAAMKEKHVQFKLLKLENHHSHLKQENGEKDKFHQELVMKLEAAEERRKNRLLLQMEKLREHAEYAKFVRERRNPTGITC